MIYIYALRDPRSGSIRYIGKTKNIKTRLLAHVSKAKTHRDEHHCARWIRQLLSEGVSPEIVVVDEVPHGCDWQRAEQLAIASHREAGHELTNLTGGGDGFHDCPQEVLKRRGASRSRTLKDPVKRAEFVDRMVASRATPEVRRKQSESVKGAWHDSTKRSRIISGMRQPDAVARRSAATSKRMHDPEIYVQHCAKAKAVANRPQGKQQLADARAKRWSDPDARVKQRVRVDAFYSDPERRKAASLASHKRWSQPGAKERHAEQLKARWARRRVKDSRDG